MNCQRRPLRQPHRFVDKNLSIQTSYFKFINNRIPPAHYILICNSSADCGVVDRLHPTKRKRTEE